jgi:hypothetical protein
MAILRLRISAGIIGAVGVSCLLASAQAPALVDSAPPFLSYGKLLTWTGVASDWQSEEPTLHLYDSTRYRGHAEFVSRGLKTGTTFKQFKQDVKKHGSRKYLPFFLYDLRGHDVREGGKLFAWALVVEAYEYDDSVGQMASEVLKLLGYVDRHITGQVGRKENGIIVLPTSRKLKPNTTIAGRLNQAGYSNRTLSELLKLCDGDPVQVLNPGIGIGYLRLVSDTDRATEAPSFHDIAVYEHLPKRIPPVSGIITLFPQTPLSHINLLARNRGTPNLYLPALDMLPQATNWIGKLVKLDCRGHKLLLSEATAGEADAFWKKQRSTYIELPEPDLSISGIVDLQAGGSLPSASQVGAKAAGYARLLKQYPHYTRRGFAVPFKYYAAVANDSDVQEQIRSLLEQKDRLSRREIRLRCRMIALAIRDADVPQELVDALRRALETHFADQRVRLRSSTNCEDLMQFNGAGLYESVGFDVKDNNKKLRKKLREVFASLWNVEAFEEREYYHIDHMRAAMAILVNKAFTDEYANGVAITMPFEREFTVVINAQRGESSVTNPDEGEVPESLVFKRASDDDYHVESRSSIEDVFLNSEAAHLLNELKEVTITVHHAMNTQAPEGKSVGADIEYKIMRETGGLRLYVKQARPLMSVLPE